MLSWGAMRCLHRGQRDAGRTIDSPFGRRAITTFRNDPSARPTRNAAIGTNCSAVMSEALRSVEARQLPPGDLLHVLVPRRLDALPEEGGHGVVPRALVAPGGEAGDVVGAPRHAA